MRSLLSSIPIDVSVRIQIRTAGIPASVGPRFDFARHMLLSKHGPRTITTVSSLCLLLLVTLGFVRATSARDDEPRQVTDPPVETRQESVQYSTELEGIDDKRLLTLITRSSQLVALEDRSPRTISGLERRVQGDLATIEKVLRSEGYYGGQITPQIDTEARPMRVVLKVDLGPQYLIREYSIRYVGVGADNERLPYGAQSVGITLGQPAVSNTVVAAQRKLLAELANTGYPLAELKDQEAIVDHSDSTMSVTVTVDPGPVALFGALTLEGAKTVDEDYLRRLVPWQYGDVFTNKKLDNYRDRLLRTGLFQAAVVERANALEPDRTLPITIVLTERKHRSIGLGARYSTDEGFGFEMQWEHRNLFGQQERLRVTADIAEIRQELTADFTKPNFLRLEQSLLANGGFGNQDTDAYQGPLATVFSGVERKINERWTVTAGVPLEYSNLEDFRNTRDYFLVGLRGVVNRDTSDDKLDPSRGTRLALALSPYQGFGDEDVSFLRGVLSGTAYHSIDDEQRFVLAGRARLGSIVGEDNEDLPANQRFYAGGGDSIRGYAFQSVGPQSFRVEPGNIERVPRGGRSLFLLSGEIRAKFTKSLGAVVFIDGGNAYDDSFPDGSGNLQWAAGFGGRYFTPVGPIRLDFGFPLNPRSFDDPFQFYISIGQAF